ncbi:MAG: hypothetical protein KGO81_03545 [Bacteroidota bacterium]|nr:hypothetical protein [Bacteroidota bacterium]
MKKIFFLAAIITATAFTTVMAQPPAGGGRGFDPAAMKARQIQQLKNSDLKLTDEQADSVVSINMEMMMQMRGMRDLSQDERLSKMKELNEARMKRWASALKDEDLAKKVADYYEKQRQQRMQQGGRGFGGGQN